MTRQLISDVSRPRPRVSEKGQTQPPSAENETVRRRTRRRPFEVPKSDSPPHTRTVTAMTGGLVIFRTNLMHLAIGTGAAYLVGLEKPAARAISRREEQRSPSSFFYTIPFLRRDVSTCAA